MGGGDSFLARLARVERAAKALDEALVALDKGIAVTKRLRDQGLSISETLALSPGPACHERVAVQLEKLAEAVHDYRVEIVHRLVDDEGWTLSEVARKMGSSRQVVSRLYHSSDCPRNGTRPRPKIQLKASRGRPALTS